MAIATALNDVPGRFRYRYLDHQPHTLTLAVKNRRLRRVIHQTGYRFHWSAHFVVNQTKGSLTIQVHDEDGRVADRGYDLNDPELIDQVLATIEESTDVIDLQSLANQRTWKASQM